MQRQIPLAREDPKAQSLPANLLRSACSASSLDLDAQLLRLQKLFDAHCLDEADATGVLHHFDWFLSHSFVGVARSYVLGHSHVIT